MPTTFAVSGFCCPACGCVALRPDPRSAAGVRPAHDRGSVRHDGRDVWCRCGHCLASWKHAELQPAREPEPAGV